MLTFLSMANPKRDPITPRRMRLIESTVHRVAKQREVPPAYITAHVRYVAADLARHEVWRILIVHHGFRRGELARIFRRDLRRLRKSVIGV